MSNCFIWSIDRTLSSGPGSNGNEGVHIPQISKAGAPPSDFLVSYLDTRGGGGGYLSAEMQSMYFVTSSGWVFFNKSIFSVVIVFVHRRNEASQEDNKISDSPKHGIE